MKEIRSAAIIGAGAVGCYLLYGLEHTLGDQLYVVAEGERKTRLETEGVVINGVRKVLNVRTPSEAKGADLIIVAVKYGALPSVIPYVKEMMNEDTVILCPMNGVDSEEILAEAVGEKNIVYSIIKVASHRIGQDVRFDPVSTTGLFFGEKNRERTERIEALDRLFAQSDVHYHVSEDILRDMWFKYALNISRNLPQAILNVGVAAYADSEHVDFISQQMRAEVVAVAAAKGINIADSSQTVTKNVFTKPDARFSTLQDLDAKRPTEIDMFSGALIRMGKQLGVPTPFNEFAFHAIKALEEKNAGLIR